MDRMIRRGLREMRGAMSNDIFALPGRFWRGNLHTHSTLSDGVLAPEEVCRRYKAEGYDFIALTDHFIGDYNYPITDTKPFRDNQFTTSNTPHSLPIKDQETGPELAQRARDAGAFVALAHPEWSGLTTRDARSIEAAHAVEVYNHRCATGFDRPHGFYTLDQLLSEGRKLTLCATDDAHFSKPDHFGGWVMVKAEENKPEALLAALKAGHHYSSTGPEFRGAHWEDRYVTVESSAVVSVIVQGYGSAAVAVHGDSMTRTRVTLDRFHRSPWMRVSIIDKAGKRAWLNPVYRDAEPAAVSAATE